MPRQRHSGSRLDVAGYALKRAEQVMIRLCDGVLREDGLSTARYVVLRVLADQPDLSAAQLARRALVSPQTMNSLVASLEKAGLVVREEHPENARTLRSRLTPAGERAMREAREKVAEAQARLFGGLSVEELDLLETLLTRCVEAGSDTSFVGGVPYRGGRVARR